MRTTSRRAIRDRLTNGKGETAVNGAGETITGGPVQPLNLMEILSRSGRDDSRGGAVSGAAQVVISSPVAGGGADDGVALSDGSRITFARVNDPGVMRDEEARILARV